MSNKGGKKLQRQLAEVEPAQLTRKADHWFADKSVRDKAQTLAASSFLWQLVAHTKTQVDVQTWIRQGGLDAEDFLFCLDTGRQHPLLKRWKDIKATTAANRSAPSPSEVLIRRLIVLAVKAVQDVDSSTDDAIRERVAKAVDDLFVKPLSVGILRNWERELDPPLAHGDRRTIANAMQKAGTDPDKLIEYFRGVVMWISARGH